MTAPLLRRDPEDTESLLSWWEGEHLAPGAQLTVEMDGVALFVADDALVLELGPGRHALSADHQPALARFLERSLFRKSPAISVAFVRTTRTKLEGSGALDPLIDPASGESVEPRLEVRCTIQASEPAKLVALLAELGEGETCEDWISDEVFSRAADAIAEAKLPVARLTQPGTLDALGEEAERRANESLAPFGLKLAGPPQLELSLEAAEDDDGADESEEDEEDEEAEDDNVEDEDDEADEP